MTATRDTASSMFRALAEKPYRFDFYDTLRRIECLFPDKPRLGRALRPVDEAVRLGQDADLSFAPSALARLEAKDGRVPRLLVRLFGLLGPNGPLPLHFTEYARERLLRHPPDATFARFLDLFNHRFIAFLYQAWAQAQPHVNHDRPQGDRFKVYVGALIGLAPEAARERDAVPDRAKLFHAGLLARQTRNADGLVAILSHYFGVPVRVLQFVGHWMTLDPRERTELGRASARLGGGAVLGQRVWDRQHKFRIVLGPLTLAQYNDFLPDGAELRKLVDWVRFYLTFELEWDVQLRLQRAEVPALRLGRTARLGWTAWLGPCVSDQDRDDLCLNAEALVERERRAA